MGSGKRASMRRALLLFTAGIRMEAERFLAEYANLVGASKWGTKRLYELVEGLVMAFKAFACLMMPPM